MLRYLSSLESGQTKNLGWSSIVASPDSSIEGPLNRFCNTLTNINRLKSYNPCSRPSKKFSQKWFCDTKIFQAPSLRLYYQKPRFSLHFKILIFAVLLTWHQTPMYHHLPSADRRSDRATKQHNGSRPPCFCQTIMDYGNYPWRFY